MLQIKGTQEFIKKLNREKMRIEHSVAETHRRVVKHIFTDLVTLTPQWSGNLASNWVIEYTTHKGGYRRAADKLSNAEWNLAQMTGTLEPPFKRGDGVVNEDNGTVSQAFDAQIEKIKGIRYNTAVRIVNYTPYAEEVENNVGPDDGKGGRRSIREVNILKSYGGVAMKGYIEMKYSNLNTLKRLAV